MGSRLGVILKTNTGWELCYDHWAAQTIGADIAIDGCDNTIDRVWEMEPLGVGTPEQWTNAPFIEGSLLIDTTTKTVVWAEESDAVYLPRIINTLVEHTWPGWTCIWSAEGVRGVLRLAGVDPAPFFTNRNYSQQTLTEHSEFLPWNSSDHRGVFSVRLRSGEIVTWAGEEFLTTTAELGPDAIQEAATQVRDRATTDDHILYHQRKPTQLPVMGVHVDFVEKQVRWWSLADEYYGLATFEGLWEGWTFESMGDAYEWQQELVGVPLRNWEQDIRDCREWMQQYCARQSRENPGLEILGVLDDTEVNMNPEALHSVPATMASGVNILSFLDQLAKGTPLPPARFVNRWGEVRGGLGSGWAN